MQNIVRNRGDVLVAKSRRVGVRLSKLAQSEAVVMSEIEYLAHCATIGERIAKPLSVVLNRHKRTKAECIAFDNAVAEVKAIAMPLFGIRYGADSSSLWFVSGSVLSDYRCEGVEVSVVAWPYALAIGSRRYGVGKQKPMPETVEATEADDTFAMVRRCMMECRMIGDEPAVMAFSSWIYHGSMIEECTLPECEECARHRFTTKELRATVAPYVMEAMQDRRSGFHGSRLRHKAPKWDRESLNCAFAGNFKRAERKRDTREALVRIHGKP